VDKPARGSELQVAGRDYSANWRDFLTWFRDNEACLEYLGRLRWLAGFAFRAMTTGPNRGARTEVAWSARTY